MRFFYSLFFVASISNSVFSVFFFKQIDSVSEEVDRQRSICDMVSSLLKHMSIKAKRG